MSVASARVVELAHVQSRRPGHSDQTDDNRVGPIGVPTSGLAVCPAQSSRPTSEGSVEAANGSSVHAIARFSGKSDGSDHVNSVDVPAIGDAHGAAPVSAPDESACSHVDVFLYFRQFVALMYKNVLIKRRKPLRTLIEIVLPVAVLALLVFIRSLITKKNLPDETHFDQRLEFNRTLAVNFLSSSLPLFGYRLSFVPKGPLADSMTTEFLRLYPGFPPVLFFNEFADEAALLEYTTSELYTKDDAHPGIWAAAVIKQQGGTLPGTRTWSYRLRMNASDPGSASNWPPAQVPDTFRLLAVDTIQVKYEPLAWHRYFLLGHTLLQDFVESYIVNVSGGIDLRTRQTRLAVQPFPTWAHVSDDFADLVSGMLPLFYVLVYLYPVSQLIEYLVQEKELRIKETMRIMGLYDSALWSSWLITYSVIFLLTSVIIALITSNNVYEYSDKGLIVWLFFLFGLTVFAYCYLLSAMFTRARVASTTGAIVFLMIFFPYFALTTDGTSDRSNNLAGCLSAPICFGLTVRTVAYLESSNIGITYDSASNVQRGFSFNDGISMMILDTVLYLLLGMYVDRVWPSAYGARLPWYFCFSPSYWHGGRRHTPTGVTSRRVAHQSSIKRVESENPNIEATDAQMQARAAIRCEGLSKTFQGDHGSTVVAVKDFTLDMFEGQIFALLGHNGAGKSTVINLLSGLYAPTSGDAEIYGDSVIHDLARIRRRLGVCPQQNVLFDLLTVEEHLHLYGAIKGLKGAMLREAVARMVEKIGISEKRDTPTAVLSGGQKRKLSVGIALIGDPKVVFLDEPTSGMDPYSRRNTWQMLSEAKSGRVVILTTHAMDEADQLGDRICIMAKGEVKCCGSSLFLKAKYGVGYTFTMTKAHKDVDEKVIEALITSHVPAAEVLANAASELSFRLPFESSHAFPVLFSTIDCTSSALGIESYGISQTTLEEVFLRVGHNDTADAKSRIRVAKELNEYSRSQQMTNSSDADSDTKGKTITLETVVDAPRDRIAAARGRTDAAAAVGHNLGKRSVSDLDAVGIDARYEQLRHGRFAPPTSAVTLFYTHFYALLIKRFHNARRDRRVLSWQIVYPFCILMLGIGLLQLSVNFTFPRAELDTAVLNSPNRIPIWGPWANVTDPASSLFGSMSDIWAYNNVAIMANLTQLAASNDSALGLTPQTRQDYAMAEYLLSTRKGVYKESRYGAFVLRQWTPPNGSATANYSDDLTVFVNTTARDGLPIFYNVYSNALLQFASKDRSAFIKVDMVPFPPTADQKTLNGSLASVIIAIAFCFIPASIVGWVVREREIKAKAQQMIAGVGVFAYWMSTYAWDVFFFIVPSLLLVIVLYIFSVNTLIGDNLGAFTLLIVLYALSVPPFTYVASFFFNSHSTAQNVMLLVYIVTGPCLLVTSVVLDIVQTAQRTNMALQWFYQCFPNYSFARGMAGLMVSKTAVIFNRPRSAFDFDVLGWPCIYMTWEIFAFWIVLFAIQWVANAPKALAVFVKLLQLIQQRQQETSVLDSAEATVHEDEDVAKERLRVQSGSAKGEMIVVEGLRKVFLPPNRLTQPKVAVREVWLGIPQTEIFGLLGVNGAGKTTLLRMLTGDELPTRGTARLLGHDIMSEYSSIRHDVGYCPQFDALVETLNAYEQLTLYARIKGMAEVDIGPYVANLVKLLGLSPYASQPCGSYSGGNKRKLSLGISLMGNPRIVFLDEPSTGMDPEARRFMWTLISRTMSGRCVVLTTHSMEESEALCDRIVVMVSGEFRCLGSSQHLKSRFGQGYQLEFNIRQAAAMGAVIDFVQATFRDARMLDRRETNVKFRIPKGSQSLAQLFGLIEAAKPALGISEYALSQASLEQIFIAFAREEEARIETTASQDTSVVAHLHSASFVAPIGGHSGSGAATYVFRREGSGSLV